MTVLCWDWHKKFHERLQTADDPYKAKDPQGRKTDTTSEPKARGARMQEAA